MTCGFRLFAPVATALALFATGCASDPGKLSATSVSELPYHGLSCEQMAAEPNRVDRRIGDLHGRLKEAADRDAAQMAVGVILFPPTLLLLEGGDGPEAYEYSRLKGEKETLEKVAIRKNCTLVTNRPKTTTSS